MARARRKSVGATDLNEKIIMPTNKNKEVLILGLTVLITGSLLAGGGWYAQKSCILGNNLIVTSLDQYLTHQPQGKIVALIDRTVGADAVVLNSERYPQLKSLIDLDKLVKEQASKGRRL